MPGVPLPTPTVTLSFKVAEDTLGILRWVYVGRVGKGGLAGGMTVTYLARLKKLRNYPLGNGAGIDIFNAIDGHTTFGGYFISKLTDRRFIMRNREWQCSLIRILRLGQLYSCRHVDEGWM
jgi:hypothetical protein